MGYYAAIAGALMTAGGTFLEGRANDIKRNRIEDAADIPGLDVDQVTGEALNIEDKYLPQATGIASKVSAANQADLLAREEAALPGIGAARQADLAQINNLFTDDATWLAGLQRRGAAMGVGKGLFGSAAGQVNTLQLSDREKVARTQIGTGLLGSLISSLRISNTPGVQAFMGATPSQLITLREGERRDRQQLRAVAAGVPGQTAAWGNWLKEQGSMLEGFGMGSMGGGMSRGGSPGAEGASNTGGLPGGSTESSSMGSGEGWGY